MSWKQILKVGKRYAFKLDFGDGKLVEFVTNIESIKGRIATSRDDDGSIGHFDIECIKFAVETNAPLSAAAETDIGEPD